MFYITLVLETAATLGMTRQYFRQDSYVLLAAIYARRCKTRPQCAA
jgi:hypothetical protein